MAFWGIAALLGMACVIGYAMLTLCRMQAKVVYPLLRVRRKDGQYTSIVITTPSDLINRNQAASLKKTVFIAG